MFVKPFEPNSWSCRIAAEAIESIRGAFPYPSFATDHAVLPMSSALKSPILVRAAAAIESKNGGSRTPKVANDHAMPARSEDLN